MAQSEQGASKGGAKRPGKTKDVVINLPDTEELVAAKLSQKEIEKLVEEIAGGQEAARSARFKKAVPAVRVRGGATVARSMAADLVDPTIPEIPNGWVKTIWRRACFR